MEEMLQHFPFSVQPIMANLLYLKKKKKFFTKGRDLILQMLKWGQESHQDIYIYIYVYVYVFSL